LRTSADCLGKHKDSLLSKHNGWITIDSDSIRRSEAPECYQSTNPIQRNKMRPEWMVQNSTAEADRYAKCAITTTTGRGAAFGKAKT
jgi:hypothetical protein